MPVKKNLTFSDNQIVKKFTDSINGWFRFISIHSLLNIDCSYSVSYDNSTNQNYNIYIAYSCFFAMEFYKKYVFNP